MKPPSGPVKATTITRSDRHDQEGDQEQRDADEDRDLRRAAAEADRERRPGDRYRREG